MATTIGAVRSAGSAEAAFWTQRSMLTFFLVGFGIPWEGWITMYALGIPSPRVRPTPLGWALFLTGDAMSLAGLAATYRGQGWLGVGALLARCVRYRLPVGWWLYAILLPFVWALAVIAAYGLRHGGVGPVRPGGFGSMVAPPVLAMFLTGPLGEEVGWRGFLLPQLLRRYSVVTASIILGLIWSLWHAPLYYNTVFSTVSGATYFTVGTVCFSMIMTVMHLNARWSVLLAMMLHWTINIAPRVVAGIFPGVPAEAVRALRPVSTAALAATGVVLVVIFGGARLLQRSGGSGQAAG